MRAHHLQLATGLGIFAVLLFAVYYLQEALGLVPCPLCVLQRMAMILFALTALAAAAHRPRRVGRQVYLVVQLAWTTLGALVAARQIYLIHHPPLVSCGIGPEERFLNSLPLAQWWPAMFEANGDCTNVDWALFGFSLPELSLITFAVLAVVAIIAARRPS